MEGYHNNIKMSPVFEEKKVKEKREKPKEKSEIVNNRQKKSLIVRDRHDKFLEWFGDVNTLTTLSNQYIFFNLFQVSRSMFNSTSGFSHRPDSMRSPSLLIGTAIRRR